MRNASLDCVEIRIAAPGVCSLTWNEDALIDWVGGGDAYSLDGSVSERRTHFAYSFDAVATAPGCRHVALYTSRETKALILRDGVIHREINRSFYCAHAYPYPIVIFRDASGRELLAHCPDEYNELQIEDLATGELLTRCDRRKSSDVFHSRLAVSSDGNYLLDAGWQWHPMDVHQVFSIEQALRDPTHLDGEGLLTPPPWGEESSSAFLPDGRLAVTLIEWEDEAHDPPFVPQLRILDPRRPEYRVDIALNQRLGTIVAVDNNHLLALYEHPKLIDLRDGTVLQSWPHIASGKRRRCVDMNAAEPPMAFDPVNRRFAIADDQGITVLQFTDI